MKLKLALTALVAFLVGDYIAIKRANYLIVRNENSAQETLDNEKLLAFTMGMSTALKDRDLVETAYNKLNPPKTESN
jgi:hypothetical protein